MSAASNRSRDHRWAPRLERFWRCRLSLLVLVLGNANAQLTSIFHELPAQLPGRALLERRDSSEAAEAADSDPIDSAQRDEPMWLKSGKFQGDIDGIDASQIKKLVGLPKEFEYFQNAAGIQLNVLKNKQLIWPNGVIPYEMDEAFTAAEVRLLERAFRTYRRRTCIRFRPHTTEPDYLHIVKGLGCYSQVGKTGGKQEISLGRGCLYHEIVLHELMHSIGAWHEHSRAGESFPLRFSRSDRDDHVRIRWENILNGMESQFDIISPALQDTQGVAYDYRSIMHYDSAAFSRNGKNTIEAKEQGFTTVIGAVKDLSELDVVKLNKLYQCPPRSGERRSRGPATAPRRSTPAAKPRGESNDSQSPKPRGVLVGSPRIHVAPDGTTVIDLSPTVTGAPPRFKTTVTSSSTTRLGGLATKRKSICQDHFLDCPGFKEYCRKVSFFYVMKAYCPQTCGHCLITANDAATTAEESL